MLARLLGYFASLPEVHVATTDEELEGIFRLRYQINVEELGIADYPGVDHDRRTIHSPVDREPTTTLMYVGAPGAPTASLRVQVWAPGQVSDAARARYSMDRFPDVGSRVVSVVTAFCAAKGIRGTAAIVALTSHGVEMGVGDKGVEVLFAECRPGLLRSYRQLGLRPFGGRPLDLNGLMVPVVAITGDLAHLERVGSPWLPVLRKLEKKGRLPTRDWRPLAAVTADGGGIEAEPGQVVAEVLEAMDGEEEHFLNRLGPDTRDRLVRSGFILDLAADVDVLSPGVANRELFVTLEGVFEVSRDGQHLDTLGPGSVFGEIAFFHGGRRTANVRTRTGARVLVLRPRALEELAESHPKDVIEIYRALAGVLAERLATR